MMSRLESLTSKILACQADIRDKYTLGKELGKGESGVTYLCTDKITREQFACKSLAKNRILFEEEVENIRREIAILQRVGRHPNIVQLKGTFEDKHSVHIVMELCAGGELSDHLTKKGQYSERQASSLFKTLIGVVDHCHKCNVVHRDLKLDNLLLADQSEDALLKLADFGSASFFEEDEVLYDVVGSELYIAPEVLDGEHDKACDVWSCGVILYILLSGTPPFSGDTIMDIFQEIQTADLDFAAEPWPHISSAAKDLIARMLQRDPAKRITIAEVLCHPWLSPEEQSDRPLGDAVVSRIKKVSAANKMRKLALLFIAWSLSTKELQCLKQVLHEMDKDNSGSITFAELKEGMAKLGTPMSDEQLHEFMDLADDDGNGTLDYMEFIAATMQLSRVQKEESLWKAFCHFDQDGSGFITVSELRDALASEDMLEAGDVERIIEEVDTDKSGTIDYGEFEAMMRKTRKEEPGAKKLRRRESILAYYC